MSAFTLESEAFLQRLDVDFSVHSWLLSQRKCLACLRNCRTIVSLGQLQRCTRRRWRRGAWRCYILERSLHAQPGWQYRTTPQSERRSSMINDLRQSAAILCWCLFSRVGNEATLCLSATPKASLLFKAWKIIWLPSPQPRALHRETNFPCAQTCFLQKP